MKISELIQLLQTNLDGNGDIEVVFPEDTGYYVPVESLEVRALFLHDGYGRIFCEARLPRQEKNDHENVVVLGAEEPDALSQVSRVAR